MRWKDTLLVGATGVVAAGEVRGPNGVATAGRNKVLQMARSRYCHYPEDHNLG